MSHLMEYRRLLRWMGTSKTSHKAAGIGRNDAAKPTKMAGEAVAYVQAACLRGVWPKAIAVDFVRL